MIPAILFTLLGLTATVLLVAGLRAKRTHHQRQRRSRRSRLFSASMGTGVDP